MMMKNKKTSTKTPLIQKNELNDAAKSSMKTRIISAIIGLAIIIPAIFIGDWVYFGLLTLAMGFACYEILGCCHKRNIPIFIILFIYIVLIAYWPMFKQLLDNPINTRVDHYFTTICIPLMMTVVGIFVLFLLTVIYKDFTVRDACFLITMGLMIGFGFQALLFIRFYPTTFNHVDPWDFSFESTVKPSLLLIFVLISTFTTDVGAYFVGVLFGKNKMNERISPKKTWEGFVGGIIISFIVSFIIAISLTASGFPFAPAITVDKWYVILLMCILLPLVATLGDFVFSSIKRSFGIKDYGKLIPGHGGILDRLDSLLFSAMITAIFIFIAQKSISGDYNLVSDLLL